MKHKYFTVKNICFIALFAAAAAVIAPFSVPLPFTSVPLSLSLFAVFLCASMLDKFSAFTAMAVYIMLGAVGLPVFSGFHGGFNVLSGPTGGYIAAYPFMAFIIALLLEKTKRRYFTYSLFMLLSLIICYSLGVTWLASSLGIGVYKAFIMGALPFIPFDAAKALLCAAVATALNKRLKQSIFI